VTTEVRDAFVDLKNKMASAPVLTLAKSDYKLVLETDASDRAIGAVLLVSQPNGTEQPSAYFPRSMTGPDKHYSATE
jgi:RNase H-like domain found in reverse transcriptase